MAAAGAVFVGAAVAFWRDLSDLSTLDRLLDATYDSALLFVGSFPELEGDPGLPLRLARVLALAITFGAAVLLVLQALRRYTGGWASKRNRDHVVVIGEGALALRLANELVVADTQVSMIVPSEYDDALYLRGVKQLFSDPHLNPERFVVDVRSVTAGATRVVSLVGQDEVSLLVLRALEREDATSVGARGLRRRQRSGLREDATVHIAFESADLAEALAGTRLGAGEGRGVLRDSFTLVDRFVSQVVTTPVSLSCTDRPAVNQERAMTTGQPVAGPSVVAAGRFTELVIAGDGQMAERVAFHAADGFGVVDWVNVVCIGPTAPAIADQALERSSWTRVAAVVTAEDARSLAKETATHLAQVPPWRKTRVLVCAENDAVALARGMALERVAPRDAEIVVLLQGAHLTSASSGPAMESLQDALSSLENLCRSPIGLVSQWAVKTGFPWTTPALVEAALEGLATLGLSIISGGPPLPLLPRELLLVRTTIEGPAGCDPTSFEPLAWAARLPLWLSRSGLSFVRTEDVDVEFGMDRVERMAKQAHEDYWENSLDDEGRAAKAALGMTRDWEMLPEQWRVSNRDQVWFYPAYLVFAGYDLSPADTGAGAAIFPSTEYINRLDLMILARAEHERWIAEKISSGWVHGGTGGAQDVEQRTHSLLEPWDELGDEQEKDIAAISGISARLRGEGLGIVPTTLRSAMDQLTAEGAPQFLSSGRVRAEVLAGEEEWVSDSGAALSAAEGDLRLTSVETGEAWTIKADRFRATYVPSGVDTFSKASAVTAVRVGGSFEVDTQEGAACVSPGEWLVMDDLDPPALWSLSDRAFTDRYRGTSEAKPDECSRA